MDANLNLVSPNGLRFTLKIEKKGYGFVFTINDKATILIVNESITALNGASSGSYITVDHETDGYIEHLDSGTFVVTPKTLQEILTAGGLGIDDAYSRTEQT